MTGIVVVSHSRALAEAAVALAGEMVHGTQARIKVAAGLDPTTFGTDAAAIVDAIVAADDGAGVVVLMDLGSAVLSAEMALDLVDADLRERDGAPDAGFVADRKTRRIEWGRPGSDYGGSIVVAAGTTNTSSVTIRLHTRDDADAEEVTRVFDQEVANIRRLLLGR